MGNLWTWDGTEVPEVEDASRGGPQNNSVEYSYPGVDGVDNVDHGFRGETFTLKCFDVSTSPATRVQEFRAKVGTVGVLTSTRTGFTDLDHVLLQNVQEGLTEEGDDELIYLEFTLTLKQIKEND